MLYNEFMDSVLDFRRSQDREISLFCNDMIEKLDSKSLDKNTVVTQMNLFNQQLANSYQKDVREKDSDLEKIEYLKSSLESKDLKEVKRYEKKIMKSISKLMGANEDLKRLTEKVKMM